MLANCQRMIFFAGLVARIALWLADRRDSRSAEASCRILVRVMGGTVMAEVALDEELIESLKDAKKSPRNFALIAKGSNPVKLLVQKKKFQDGALAKARTEAKGNDIIIGVLVVSGSNLTFQVLWEEPSIKETKIKDLIAEQADMTVKVQWEVVTALTEVREDEKEQGKGPSVDG